MGGHFDIDSKLNEIKNIELELQKEENYQDLNKINELNVKLQNLKKSTTKYQELSNHILTNIELLDLLTEDDNEVKEIENNLESSILSPIKVYIFFRKKTRTFVILVYPILFDFLKLKASSVDFIKRFPIPGS